MEHVVIVGGGGTGAALALDLAQRGFSVSLFERGELTSGTTGRHHGLLHSGARYAVHDPEAARECARENAILRRIVPDALEKNGGLFVALDEADLSYRDRFLESCAECGIATRRMTGDEARAIEPALSPRVVEAVEVPDGVIDAYRLPLSFFAAARAEGALIQSFVEVVEITTQGGAVTGVRLRDARRAGERLVQADVVVNACGPWAGATAALAGIEVPIQPGPGVMVAVEGRLTERAVNRLHPASEGDIVVPQRKLTVLGTSLWLADAPDAVRLPPDHVERMVSLCGAMVPAAAEAPVVSAWCASRPLRRDETKGDAQQISRSFECIDHGERDGLAGFFSVIGGKATTLRAMAEVTADRICASLGRDRRCRTHETPLASWRDFFPDSGRAR